MSNSEKFWDKQSKRFDQNTNKYSKAYSKTFENTKKYLGCNDIVLDFACGTGIFSIEFGKYVKEMYAIDNSSGMIDIAKKKVIENSLQNVHFVKTTLDDQRLKKKSFDVILAFNILHLLKNPLDTLQRINELLKAGGIFISSTAFLGEKKFYSYLIFLLHKLKIIPYVNHLKVSQLEEYFANESFEIIEKMMLYQSISNIFIVAKKN